MVNASRRTIPRGMAERNGTTMHVDPVRIEADLIDARQGLRGERLIELSKIEIVARRCRLALASALRVAGTGPMPMTAGSTPAAAVVT